MPNIICPMHPDPKPTCSDTGECPICGREWEETKHGLISKMRRVMVVSPIKAGEKIDDCLQPIKES